MKKSFENLRQIAQHPVFSKYVVSIIYECRWLADTYQGAWERNIRNAFIDLDLGDIRWPDTSDLLDCITRSGIDISDTLASQSRDCLDKGWKAYSALMAEQDYMQNYAVSHPEEYKGGVV